MLLVAPHMYVMRGVSAIFIFKCVENTVSMRMPDIAGIDVVLNVFVSTVDNTVHNAIVISVDCQFHVYFPNSLLVAAKTFSSASRIASPRSGRSCSTICTIISVEIAIFVAVDIWDNPAIYCLATRCISVEDVFDIFYLSFTLNIAIPSKYCSIFCTILLQLQF